MSLLSSTARFHSIFQLTLEFKAVKRVATSENEAEQPYPMLAYYKTGKLCVSMQCALWLSTPLLLNYLPTINSTSFTRELPLVQWACCYTSGLEPLPNIISRGAEGAALSGKTTLSNGHKIAKRYTKYTELNSPAKHRGRSL